MAAAQRRDDLLDRAAELVVSGGTTSVTMESVSQRSGVNRRLAYRHFESSDDLLVALLERELGAIDEQAGRANRADLPLDARIRASIRAFLNAPADNASLVVTLLRDIRMGSKAHGYLEKRQRALEDGWAEAITVEFGIRRPTARAAATMFLRGAEALLELCAVDGIDRDDAEDLFVTAAMSTVRAIAEEHNDATETRET